MSRTLCTYVHCTLSMCECSMTNDYYFMKSRSLENRKQYLCVWLCEFCVTLNFHIHYSCHILFYFSAIVLVGFQCYFCSVSHFAVKLFTFRCSEGYYSVVSYLLCDIVCRQRHSFFLSPSFTTNYIFFRCIYVVKCIRAHTRRLTKKPQTVYLKTTYKSYLPF